MVIVNHRAIFIVNILCRMIQYLNSFPPLFLCCRQQFFYFRDYGSSIFANSICASYQRTINYTTDTIESGYCDETYTTTLGWKVDELRSAFYGSCDYRSIFALENGCENVEPGTPFDESKVLDLYYLFRMLFRAPSLQKEFWDLWDLSVQHRLIDGDGPTSATAAVTSSDSKEDLFGAGKMLDEMYKQVANFAQGTYNFRCFGDIYFG